MCQKSKLSTEAGTWGQVRASLWGYGFIGMFRDEEVQTLQKGGGRHVQHRGKLGAAGVDAELGELLRSTMNANDLGRRCLGRKAWIAGMQRADRMRRGD